MRSSWRAPQVGREARSFFHAGRLFMRLFVFASRSLLLMLASVALAGSPVRAQIPQKFENLQFFPKDIPRDSLIQIMRGFSFALGVRCQYCHTGGDGISFQGVNFASDEKATKKNARFMLRMVDTVNRVTLAALPQRSDPPVRVACMTCHRGVSKPTTLETVLLETTESQGADSAVKRYRDLREGQMELGRYDFGEITLSEVARKLAARGKNTDAMRMLELSAEFHPNSPNVDMELGDAYARVGDKDKAIARYRLVQAKQPNNPNPARKIRELGGVP